MKTIPRESIDTKEYTFDMKCCGGSAKIKPC
jgi:hypothetical protein